MSVDRFRKQSGAEMMAKKAERGDKSEAVRAFLAQNPEATGKQIIEGVKAASGLTVSLPTVQSAKKALGLIGGKGSGKRAAKKGVGLKLKAGGGDGVNNGFVAIDAAVNFISAAGGLAAAKAALERVEKISATVVTNG